MTRLIGIPLWAVLVMVALVAAMHVCNTIQLDALRKLFALYLKATRDWDSE